MIKSQITIIALCDRCKIIIAKSGNLGTLQRMMVSENAKVTAQSAELLCESCSRSEGKQKLLEVIIEE